MVTTIQMYVSNFYFFYLESLAITLPFPKAQQPGKWYKHQENQYNRLYVQPSYQLLCESLTKFTLTPDDTTTDVQIANQKVH